MGVQTTAPILLILGILTFLTECSEVRRIAHQAEAPGAVMDPWTQRMIRQVQSVPPTCLNGLKTTPFHPRIWNNWVAWSLACPCGGNEGAVLGYPSRDLNPDYNGPEYFLSPLAFQCADCGDSSEIIDTSIHGYDAELDKQAGRVNRSLRGNGPRTAMACQGCGAASYSVTARFSHSDFDLIEDEPELEPRAQDFFDVFDCVGECHTCGEKWSIANYELS